VTTAATQSRKHKNAMDRISVCKSREIPRSSRIFRRFFREIFRQFGRDFTRQNLGPATEELAGAPPSDS
jgi:hypothetical protein